MGDGRQDLGRVVTWTLRDRRRSDVLPNGLEEADLRERTRSDVP